MRRRSKTDDGGFSQLQAWERRAIVAAWKRTERTRTSVREANRKLWGTTEHSQRAHRVLRKGK